MSAVIPQKYPGDAATAEEILRLAEEFQKAARALREQGRQGEPLTLAPCRLSAIHAIELFLSALLLHKGHPASEIRGMRHSLPKRAAHLSDLRLRKRTAAHLSDIEKNREYLVTRYAPEKMKATVSQINRLSATLDEVAKKVTAVIKAQPTAPQVLNV
jgi:hypothetical protein